MGKFEIFFSVIFGIALGISILAGDRNLTLIIKNFITVLLTGIVLEALIIKFYKGWL